jgi:hypothetical protein
VGSGFLLKNAGGEGIVTYCIFDSDYHQQEAIRARYKESKERGISLHIWKRKEIENYLLNPRAIQRAIQAQITRGDAYPSEADVVKKLSEIAENLKQDVIDCVATHIHNADRKRTVATANQMARRMVAERWKTLDQCLSIIPGKEALSQISRWIQEKYKTTVSGLLIAHHMTTEDIEQEMQDILMAIEECEPFPYVGNSESDHAQ